MISNPVELITRRRLVAAFINADYAKVSFIRQGAVIDMPSGGTTRGPDIQVAEQKVAIIPSKRRYDTGLVNSEAGAIPNTEYLLLGTHTLDVAEDDGFYWLDQYYKVIGIHPIRRSGGEPESILCAIEYRGEDNA